MKSPKNKSKPQPTLETNSAQRSHLGGEITRSPHEVETILALAWESLFEIFCQPEKPTLASLSTLSAIIQKLTSSYTQIKSLELKIHELYMKEDEHNAKILQLQATIQQAKKAKEGLSLETLQNIEHQLKLL